MLTIRERVSAHQKSLKSYGLAGLIAYGVMNILYYSIMLAVVLSSHNVSQSPRLLAAVMIELLIANFSPSLLHPLATGAYQQIVGFSVGHDMDRISSYQASSLCARSWIGPFHTNPTNSIRRSQR